MNTNIRTKTTKTSLLELNHDVLSMVLARLSPHDASQLALASHLAYAIAMPRVLADVALGGAFHKPAAAPAHLQLRRFCALMLADAGAGARLGCLQSLEVRRDAVRTRLGGVWAVDAECVRLLAEVVAKAVRLHGVTLWGLDALAAAYPPIVDALAQCPHLATVRLGGGIPPLSIVVRAFPHVRSLKLVDGAGSSGPDWDVQAAEGSRSWPHLDHIDSGSPILSLAGSVRRVDLRNPVSADETALANALQYLRNTQPVVLSCAVDALVSDEEFVARIPEVACNVKYLEIVLHGCESLASVVQWMMRVGPLLASLPLLGLSLSSSTPALFPSPFSSPAASPPSTPFPPAAGWTNTGSFSLPMPSGPVRPQPPTIKEIANQVSASIPSLRYVALQPYGPLPDVDQAWFMAGDWQTGRTIQLADDEGARIEHMLKSLNIYDLN